METVSADSLRSEYVELLEMMAKTADMEAQQNESPREDHFSRASWISRICFFWIYPFVLALRRGDVTVGALQLAQKDRSSASTKVFKNFWNQEIDSRNPSLSRALRRAFYPKFIRAVILKLSWSIMMVFLSSFMIFFFVQEHFLWNKTKKTKPEARPLWWALCGVFAVVALAEGFVLHHMESMCVRLGIRIRAALVTCIYQKALTAEVTQFVISPILSLLSKDCSTLLQLPISLIRLGIGILEICGSRFSTSLSLPSSLSHYSIGLENRRRRSVNRILKPTINVF